MATELAWHFVGSTLRDGRPIPPDGKWFTHKGPVVMCETGLHASTRMIDALMYAPGNTICRVVVDIIKQRDADKLVARRRKILWRYDAEDTLRQFARQSALSVAHLWDMPDVVREDLVGDDNLRDAGWAAARDAASAARDAAWNAAAWAAAWAARDAARAAAAWAAARDAARDARAAAGDAARDAALSKFDDQLTAMIREAAGHETDGDNDDE